MKPNSTNTDNRTSDIASSLVKVYAAFFRMVVKSSEVPERLAMALLNGLSRAAPFLPDSSSESQSSELLEEINDIFRLVHNSNLNISFQALAVLFQLSTHRVELRDRYFQALYRRLRDTGIFYSSRGATILHLIYRSMLADNDAERGAAFTLRLLQMCLSHPNPGFIIGSLILLSKVQASKKNLIVSSPASMHLQSMAFKSSSKLGSAGSDSEEEHFSDAPISDDEEGTEKPTIKPAVKEKPTVISWDHRYNVGRHSEGSKVDRNRQCYNPEAREPMYARAGGYPSWPLVVLSAHAHPTVSLLAKTLLQGEPVTYTGNPFDDFSLAHFLDRFAFKKPKLIKKNKRNVPPGRALQRREAMGSGSRAVSVDSASFRHMSVNRVAADEQFFHNYFKLLESRVDPLKKKQKKADDSDDSVSDEEFDTYLHKFEKGLVPPADELENDDEVEFDPAEFSDQSDNEQPDGPSGLEPDSEDDATFAAMDGLTSSGSTKRKTKKHAAMDIDLDSLMNIDEDDDDDDEEADIEGEDSDDNVDLDFDDDEDGDEDDDGDDDEDDFSDSDDEQSSSKTRAKLDSLFVSAKEVGKLYGARETTKAKKQRLWEEKRSQIHLERPNSMSNRVVYSVKTNKSKSGKRKPTQGKKGSHPIKGNAQHKSGGGKKRTGPPPKAGTGRKYGREA